jgi:predicted RNA-binding Zn-ribbon protein involved in translation (DUF1610 family)
MFKDILKFFGFGEVLPDKDPNDFTLTENSTPWVSYEACPSCKKNLTTRNQLDKICPACGHIGGRVYWTVTIFCRMIVKDGKWIYQYKNE